MTSTLDFAGFRPVVVAPRATFAAKGKTAKSQLFADAGSPGWAKK